MNPEEYQKLTFEQMIDYWMGRMILAIGRGDVRGEVAALLLHTMNQSYERGLAEGKKIASKRGKK